MPNSVGYQKIHESMMVELSNGSLMTSMRNPNSDYRAVSVSSGVQGTWSTPYSDIGVGPDKSIYVLYE